MKKTAIKSILIANRGEIARRVIKTAKKQKIATVAVYSDLDEDAVFVKETDQKVALGGKTLPESYLNHQKIINIALDKKCDAIHPGYGFLSENPVFAQKCHEAKIIFIGPPATVIEAMGDKLRARQIAQKLGVPTVPGSDRLQTLEAVQIAAEKISFPVILKAAAGGGGIGMKKVEKPADLPQAFKETSSRAQATFGDPRVFMEKYLEEPHHIEIQFLRDQRGTVLTFYERDCSVQRRYQKIIEESPSTYVTSELREQLRAATRKMVNGIDYVNAGTVEFVVDKDKNFYFLETNTRLQVEHPVTEVIAGLDLVELQIKIAAGELLPWQESELEMKGWGIEARIYAEDPVNFFPSPGTITAYSEPTGAGIRVDSGYAEQSIISPYYDPLVAKLITHGETREQAIERMIAALKNYQITGIKTNIPFLIKAFSTGLFKSGSYDTHFVEKMKKQS